MAEGKNSKLVKLVGLSVAGAGVSHFVKPQLFESITKPAFPKDTQKHIYTNGGIETAIGLGLLLPKTRKLATIGTLGYVAYLAGNAVRNR
ncbi:MULTISPECIES: membrane protein [Mycobacteriaceae]|jgi:uncharacterized membrane protein|uniref:Membrane protein n=5 Tax=Mycolicibacterium TaxID=1866885 RepID=A0A0N9YCE3_MYCFO|nr:MULTISPECIES: membrane protein [Mycolicibacterium]AIY44934.1 Putative membrane protein [Mycobacterium sp. VKM Ac-1817D]CRL81849.1 membrane protein [Mycolicibacter nonchromogenicus]SEP77743.1 hypothetical protein SAMN04488583_1014 [Mycobacterium sp. 88mf]SFF15766.1 hypothetical protein SAMN04488582_101587 [Mycobacterium sp. 455mf]ALI24698.1 Putative membrane protein [Mycolicibacterium fortuitum]